MTEEKMRKIPIRNPELIAILDDFVSLRTENPEAFERWMHVSCKDHSTNRHWWTGDEYLREIISQGNRHEGFPDYMYGYEFRVNNKKHRFFENEFPETQEEAKWRTNFIQKLGRSNDAIMNFLGTRNNALTAIYPPGGFISWHNNANACAYNFIFSYSETGDGGFSYWDVDKQEVVFMQDEPGWQLKAGYFGHYGEPERLMYHKAESDCWRHTISFCFNEQDVSAEYREQVIDEISSE